MPGASGRELANHFVELQPGLKVLYMSGYTGDLVAQHGVLEAGTLLLEKPFTLQSLLTKVRQALHGPQNGKVSHRQLVGPWKDLGSPHRGEAAPHSAALSVY